MGVVVTGISGDGDLRALVAALEQAGLSQAPLSVIEPGDVASAVVRRGSVRGPELITGDGSTSVPGLTRSEPSAQLRAQQPLENPLQGRFDEIGIPHDEAENYLDALAAGRSIVTYETTTADEASSVERAFGAAGLARVKRF